MGPWKSVTGGHISLVLVLALSACGGGGGDPGSPGDAGDPGDTTGVANHRLYGVYDYVGTQGTCPETGEITVGSDMTRFWEYSYFYIPSSGPSERLQGTDAWGDSYDITITISGRVVDRVWWEGTDPAPNTAKLTFSDDYETAVVTGNAPNDPGETNPCNGEIHGTMTRK